MAGGERGAPDDRGRLAGGDWPGALLLFLVKDGQASGRRLRLFACACVRRLWPLLHHARCRQAVETAEGFADGLAGERELQAARGAIPYAVRQTSPPATSGAGRDIQRELEQSLRAASRDTTQARAEDAAWSAARNAAQAAAKEAWLAVGEVPVGTRTSEALRVATDASLKAQAALFRDIFGNPFRPLPPLSPSLRDWNGGLVPRLAQTAYDHRVLPSGHLDPARLAVVCDALLDAACPADAEILLHLRADGPHLRGCWAVDAVLGKS
jgi:hypothetical protein